MSKKEAINKDELAETVASLRASRAAIEQQEAEQGEAAGRDWALKRADYRELKLMAEMALSPDGIDYFEVDNQGWVLAKAFAGQLAQFGVDCDAEGVMENLFPDPERRMSIDYCDGFMKGAAAVLKEVELQVLRP